MIVAKAVNMARLMNVPVVGLVENMAYYKCPDCGKTVRIFGDTRAEDVAGEFKIKDYAELPIDPVISTMIDAGEVEKIDGQYVAPLADAIEKEFKI